MPRPLLLPQLVHMASHEWWSYGPTTHDLPREQIVVKIVEKVIILTFLIKKNGKEIIL